MNLPRTCRLSMPTTLPALAKGQARLVAFLRDAGLPSALASRAELILEEVAVNVIHHGFADAASRDAAVITLEATALPPGGCILVFEDPGRPFDPTQAILPAPARNLAEAKIGGLGLPLIRRLASSVAYARLEPQGINRFTVTLGEV